MPLYESTFIARQDLSPADLEQLTDSMCQLVAEQGGKVVRREYWGLKSLSYRINKNRKGHYMHLGLNAPAPAVKEFERKLRLSEDVMRLMTIRVEKLEEGQTVMMNPAASGARGDAPSAGRSGPMSGRPTRAPRRRTENEE
jgi:small subunit ribosomal protein S6